MYERCFFFACLFVLLEEVKRMIMVGQVLLESSLDHLFLLFPASCWPFHLDRWSPPLTHPNPCTAPLHGAPFQSWHLHVYITSFIRPSQTNLVIQSPLPLTPAYTLQSSCVNRECFLSAPSLWPFTCIPHGMSCSLTAQKPKHQSSTAKIKMVAGLGSFWRLQGRICPCFSQPLEVALIP